ncbi:MAG: RnfABCDGE type electron transport complex subunit G [Bacteroidales bacterium]
MAKKLESTFLNMVLVLTAITCIAGAALAGVFKLTEDPIRLSNLAKQKVALEAVCPEFDNNPLDESRQVEVNGVQAMIYTARKGEVFVGSAVETITKKGFSGEIRVMVGFEADGRIKGYQVLKHAETPGLGSKMQEWFSATDRPAQSIIGKNPGVNNLTVSKKGGEVDAITAATISSDAFLDAVKNAYDAVQLNTTAN